MIGVDHHGNTALEPYRAESFLCWWERPRDLTLALDHLGETGPFARRLDLDHVGAAGFSLGGHTVWLVPFPAGYALWRKARLEIEMELLQGSLAFANT